MQHRNAFGQALWGSGGNGKQPFRCQGIVVKTILGKGKENIRELQIFAQLLHYGISSPLNKHWSNTIMKLFATELFLML